MTESCTLGAGRLQPREQSAWDDTQGRFPPEPEPPPSTTVVHADTILLPLCRELVRLRQGGARGSELQAAWRKLAAHVALLDDVAGRG